MIKTQVTFTDTRPELEGIEIRNYGSSTFEVFRNGSLTDAFTAYESNLTYSVSNNFAYHQASDHFDELSEQELELENGIRKE